MNRGDGRLVYGVASLLAWNTLSLTLGETAPFLAFCAVSALGYAVIGMMGPRLGAKETAVLGACGGALGIASLIAGLAFGDSPMTCLIATGVLAALAQTCLSLGWFALYQPLPPKRALCLALTAFILGSIARAAVGALNILSDEGGFVLSALLVTGSALMLILDNKLAADSADASAATPTTDSMPPSIAAPSRTQGDKTDPFAGELVAAPTFTYRTVLAELGVWGLAFGVLYFETLHWAGEISGLLGGLLAQAVVCGALLWWFASKISERMRTALIRVGALLLCLGATTVSFLAEGHEVLLATSVLCLRIIMLVLVNIRLFAACEQSSKAALPTYGLGRGAFALGEAIGMGLALWLQKTMSMQLPENLAPLVVAAIFLLALNSLLKRTLVPAPISERRPLSSKDIQELCQQVAAAYDLTKRETEVLAGICANETSGKIAHDLGISENTVLTYSKQLYRKMGIHSKYDLLLKVLGEQQPSSPR